MGSRPKSKALMLMGTETTRTQLWPPDYARCRALWAFNGCRHVMPVALREAPLALSFLRACTEESLPVLHALPSTALVRQGCH